MPIGKRIAIIQGHPDRGAVHFCHALAFEYEHCAKEAGHQTKTIQVARLSFPVLRAASEWERDAPCADILEAQRTIAWADHLVIVFPLWLGDMPALLKAFFEQAMRPGFAIGKARPGGMPKKLLAKKSARVIVTMGMPAFFYRLFYRAHSVKNLERNILRFCGISPVRTSLIGTVGSGDAEHRESWLTKIAALGFRAL